MAVVFGGVMQYLAFSFDKQTTAQALTQAIAAYELRFGRQPTELLVSAGDAALAFDGTVTVRADLIRAGMLGLVV